MRTKFLIIFCLIACVASAQEKFTDYLTRQNTGEGKVILKQDSALNALVNGDSALTATTTTTTTTTTTVTKTEHEHGKLPEEKVEQKSNASNKTYTNGYRVQVYAGSNNRKSKNEAQTIASRVRAALPDVPVYTNFASPRWICRVGNCRTYEEASDLLRQLRTIGHFSEATIVRSKISY